jgi:hypothetical protein
VLAVITLESLNVLRVVLLLGVMILSWNGPAFGQTVSGVRALGGGVGALFSLVGPGNLYIDNNGTQGYMYTQGTFETYNFRNPQSGITWAGAMMTLGPQLSIGLIQGANQAGFSPLVLPPPPRFPPSVPDIESTLLDIP